ncbi:MAG: DUF2339 domain-containing protein [Candidatus Magasanikbacteria bacterium]|nr:DUF2339 domain-containing protein [Candidatus Magasanikbacteria bacterium]
MSILLFLLGLGILLWVSNLSNRINTLEALLKDQRSETTYKQPSTVQASPAIIQTQTTKEEQPQTNTTVSESKSSTESPFILWLKTDWQIKLGAFLLLISFGWFARYAFLHDWISATGRIILGIAAGIGIAAFGTNRLKSERTQGEIFLVLGSSIVLVTVFAARYYYQMFTPMIALGMMFAASAFVAVMSAKEKNALLAFTGLIMGGIAPLLTLAPETQPLSLFTYLLAITLGSIWLAYFHERRDIVAAGLGVYVYYSLVHFSGNGIESLNVMMLALFFVFAALFAAANITSYIKNKKNEHSSDIFVALINNIILLMWILVLAPESWKIGLLLAWAALYAGCAFACRVFGSTKELWSMYYGSAITLLAIATAQQFEGNILIIAFTLEALAIIGATHIIKKDGAVTRRMTWLLLLPTLMSLDTILNTAWMKGGLTPLVSTLSIIAAAYIGLGLALKYLLEKSKETDHVIRTVFIIGSGYLYILLWKVLHVWLTFDIATMTSLVIYTLVGLTTNLYGQLHKNKTLRLYGGIMLGLVVTRLLIVDIWEMAIPGRIVTFFLIGTLLMSTAFIGRANSRTIAQ